MPKVPAVYLETRRSEIIQAARRTFSRKDSQAATMADIAVEAGLTPGALYRYFPNKDELVAACFGDNADDVSQQWLASNVGPDPLEDLRHLAKITFDRLNLREARTGTMIHLDYLLDLVRNGDEARLDEMRAERLRVREAVLARLEAAAAIGQVPSGLHLPSIAEALVSFYWGARLARLTDPSADTDAQLAQVMKLLGSNGPAGGE
ncbi:MAG: TetR/AcrR family transcriptional regulator [Chloroflexi bacterium]|nr:TetR/AcrR family transcriptional regulator [Chloroflexota bacterium]